MMHRGSVGQIEVTHDDHAEAVYIYLPNHPKASGCVSRTFATGKGVLLDYDADNMLIGVEILLPVKDCK
jgi:uncharacterized protein YuzE